MCLRVGRMFRWPMMDFKSKLLMLLTITYLVPLSMQLRSSHPSRQIVDQINASGGPYIGLVLAFPAEEIPLKSSGLFVPNSNFPPVELSGRKFNVGKIYGVDVIYVVSGEQTVNAAMTVEILLQTFEVKGVVHYGIAGGTNSSLTVGDVSVPSYFAFTDSWKWMEYGSTDISPQELIFGAFNFPREGKNLLAGIHFTPVQLYSDGHAMRELFWLPVDPYWFNVATQLKGVHLQRCLNESLCLPKAPEVVFGLKGSTANVFLANEAYAKFLYKEFNISTVDEESSAVAMTSLSNGVPCIVFRGISDVAGGDKLSLEGLSSLAAINAFNVAVRFVELISRGERRLF